MTKPLPDPQPGVHPAPHATPPSPAACSPEDAAALLAALRSAADHLPSAVYVKDAAGRYLFANAAAARLLGHEPQALLGHRDEELLPADLARLLRSGEQAAIDKGLTLRREERLPSLEGRPAQDVLAVRIPVPSAQGDAALLCGLWSDLSGLRQLQAELRQAKAQLEAQQRENEALRLELRDQNVRDPVSGVYMRRHFDEQLRREIDLSMREQREFALVSVQIDAYPELLAAHGTAGAERVLQALGRLLRGNTRAMDAPCRLGDDAFAVLLSGVGLATAYNRMESVRRQCEAQLVMLEGQDLRFTVSMGLASFPHTAQEREPLLRAAAMALEDARSRGGNAAVLARIPFRV